VSFKRLVDGVQLVVAGLAGVTVVLLLAAQPTVATDAPADPGAGAALFAADCAGCHSADGSGGIGPALVGEGALAGFEDAEAVARFVSTGSPGRMPGFETRLTPDEVNAIAVFVFGGLGS
jgi:mono/diheme cytochrome c family protein